jgi:hypothetical protein
MYDDNYGTCSRTYATLIIKYLDPSTITARLGIEPSESRRKGELIRPFPTRIAPMNRWFLCTKGRVESRDSRRHIDWLLDRVEGKAGEILRLQAEGCEMVVSGYWVSASGQGEGCVTTGEAWQFAKLAGSEVLLEPRRYYIDKVETILGAFRAIIDQWIGST